MHCSRPKCVSFWGTSYSRPPIDPYLTSPCYKILAAPLLQTTVYVQVVFMKLGEIDTIKETFSADVFIQARWREPRLDGRDTAIKKVRDAVSD